MKAHHPLSASLLHFCVAVCLLSSGADVAFAQTTPDAVVHVAPYGSVRNSPPPAPATSSAGDVVLAVAPPSFAPASSAPAAPAGASSVSASPGVAPPHASTAVVPVVIPNAPALGTTSSASNAPPASPNAKEPLTQAAAIAAAGPVVGLPPFTLKAGDDIRVQLGKWLLPQGWHLEWSATAGPPGRLRDLVVDEDYTLHPKDVADLLQTLFAGYGFTADVDSSPLIRRIVIKNDSNVSE